MPSYVDSSKSISKFAAFLEEDGFHLFDIYFRQIENEGCSVHIEDVDDLEEFLKEYQDRPESNFRNIRNPWKKISRADGEATLRKLLQHDLVFGTKAFEEDKAGSLGAEFFSAFEQEVVCFTTTFLLHSWTFSESILFADRNTVCIITLMGDDGKGDV